MYQLRNGSQPPQNSSFAIARDPMKALKLSLIPGLGQMYNGERIKGFLFLDVGLVNFLLLWLILFARPIAQTLATFFAQYHVQLNYELLQLFQRLQFGQPMSLIVLAAVLSFMFYVARDAYDAAQRARLRAMYPDEVVSMPEAASGSYLLHIAGMLSCILLALICIMPAPKRQQVTDIEFVTNTVNENAHVRNSNRQAEFSNRNAPVHDRTRPVEAQNHRAAAPSNPNAAAQPTPPQRAVQTVPNLPRPVMPVRPVTSNALPTPISHPQPTPPAPTHMPMPRPTLIASAPTAVPPTPLPSPQAPMPMNVEPSPFSSSSSIRQSGLALPRATATKAATPSLEPTAASTATDESAHPAPSPSEVRRAPMGSPAGISAPSPTRSSGPHIAISNLRPAAPAGDATTDSTANPEQAGKGRSVDTSASVDFGWYMAELQRRIKRNWFPPHDPRSNKVIVRFTISVNGEMSNLRLFRSSGLHLADQAALDAIAKAAPFQHLPAGAKDDADIEFSFDYNVFNGRTSGY